MFDAVIDKNNPRIKHRISNTGEAWLYDDKFHRLTGPAVSYMVGLTADDEIIEVHEWWYHGTKIECSSQEEFERIIKMKVFW